jgi:hypothetical protein
MTDQRPITADELAPFFKGYEEVFDLAVTRYHLAAERQRTLALEAQLADTETETGGGVSPHLVPDVEADVEAS